jgi:hypothetical protein
MGAEPARRPLAETAAKRTFEAEQREELARLREELALAHGRVRELELDRRLCRP